MTTRPIIRTLMASAAIATLAATSAVAADIARRPAPQPVRPVVYTSAPYNWTGGYIGINAGGGWGHSGENGPFASSYHTKGFLLGGTLGYNMQAGSLVYGLEGDIAWSSIRGSSACGATNCETRLNWLGTARGRLGFAMDRFMPYITGGLAVGGVENRIAAVGNASDTKFGWTIGAGLETAITPNWTAKAEYLFVDLGRTASVGGSEVDVQNHIVRAGLNYRF